MAGLLVTWRSHLKRDVRVIDAHQIGLMCMLGPMNPHDALAARIGDDVRPAARSRCHGAWTQLERDETTDRRFRAAATYVVSARSVAQIILLWTAFSTMLAMSQ
jgi:hypothetical protein